MKHKEYIALQKYCAKLESALRVIHTWATFNAGSELNPTHVKNLCKKTLNYKHITIQKGGD